MNRPTTSRQVRSELSSDGTLTLTLATMPVAEPAPDEVIIRIEAAPINPSDLGLLLGPADPTTFEKRGDATVAPVPLPSMATMSARVGQSLPVGNEGAGTVVAAGAQAQHLVGRTVAIVAGSTYAEYRTVKANEAIELPDGITARQGASITVNPMTALSMVETMRTEGHSALVHTAAASNLGQMLVKLCRADGVSLVNIVRSPAQRDLLEGLSAAHVVDSSAPDFTDQLVATLVDTGATLAFDAIGGGPLAGQILGAMERASSKGQAFSRYGSFTHKQVYIYGRLDLRPTELPANAGMAWGIGGYLLTPFLMKTGPARVAELRARVLRELTTTFESTYTRTIGLDELLDPETLRAYALRRTGEKYLLNPSARSQADQQPETSCAPSRPPSPASVRHSSRASAPGLYIRNPRHGSF